MPLLNYKSALGLILICSATAIGQDWIPLVEKFERLDASAPELPKFFESSKIRIDSTQEIFIGATINKTSPGVGNQIYKLSGLRVSDFGDTRVIVEGIILNNEVRAGDCQAASKSELKIILYIDKKKLELVAKPILFGYVGRTLDSCHIPMDYDMIPYLRITELN